MSLSTIFITHTFFILLQHRQIGDDKPEGWVPVPNSVGLVKEVKENKEKSREETEELLETEDVQHLGDITDDVSVNHLVQLIFLATYLVDRSRFGTRCQKQRT